ncbi:hypothetical protein ACLKA6_015279 [Drosophila palustris]
MVLILLPVGGVIKLNGNIDFKAHTSKLNTVGNRKNKQKQSKTQYAIQKAMSPVQTLTPQQRQLADGIVRCICRGNYDKALSALNYMTGTLPPLQENSLRQILKRLQRMNKKLDSLVAYNALIGDLPHLDAGVIRGMDTHIPRSVLAEIYDLILQLNFEQFHLRLEHIQWVEYSVIRHTLILYEHCTKLKAAQLALDNHQFMSGNRVELYILYSFILPIGIYVVSFFF